MSAATARQAEPALNSGISDAMVERYAAFYEHDRPTATTWTTGDVPVHPKPG
jgi:hypothetical protein